MLKFYPCPNRLPDAREVTFAYQSLSKVMYRISTKRSLASELIQILGGESRCDIVSGIKKNDPASGVLQLKVQGERYLLQQMEERAWFTDHPEINKII